MVKPAGGMLWCPRHLGLLALCRGSRLGRLLAPPHTEMHSAAARSLPHKCWPGKLGARRWETAVVETQRAAPAAATSGLGRPQRELELPRPADLPSSRAEAKSDRAAHSANFRPTYTGPALGLFPLPPRPESYFVEIVLYMHKA